MRLTPFVSKISAAAILDMSGTHGIGQNWTYKQYHLDSGTEIQLVVLSTNAFGLHSEYQIPGLIFNTPGTIYTVSILTTRTLYYIYLNIFYSFDALLHIHFVRFVHTRTISNFFLYTYVKQCLPWTLWLYFFFIVFFAYVEVRTLIPVLKK